MSQIRVVFMTINFVITFSVFDKTSKEIADLCNIPNDQRIQKIIKMVLLRSLKIKRALSELQIS